MNKTPTILLACLGLITAHSNAQNCSFNEHPVTLVAADGTPAPMLQGQYEPYAQFSTQAVYVSFASTTPSGTYYVHVTDVIGDPSNDVVLSTNDPMDRFVSVQNDNGVIRLSLPFATSVGPDRFGVGLNGVGQSLLLTPFDSSPATPCEFAVQVGDTWDLQFGPTWPYIVRGGWNEQLLRCAVLSYAVFRVGDGSGCDVSGTVYLDIDGDNTRDSGEPGVAQLTVRLVGSGDALTSYTDNDGHYSFANVPAQGYAIEIVTGTAYLPTGSGTTAIAVCGCGDVDGVDFGVAEAVLTCEPRAREFWISSAGRAIIQQSGALPLLPALHLRDFWGRHVAPCSSQLLAWFLWATNNWNMAYSLSVELAVMHCNVMAGFVDPMCVLEHPVLGQMTVANLMAESMASLALHGHTPWWSQNRSGQSHLRDALRGANENSNWR